MDRRLLAWARARRSRGGAPTPLWLFTDRDRMDVLRVVAALPPRLCGVVLRDGSPAPDHRRIAAICRARRLPLASFVPLPGAGRHLRRGQGRRAGALTASAHDRVELVRAFRAGAAHVFLSPAFPTASHPGASALGPRRWAALARFAPRRILALGGITGRSVRRLPPWTSGAAAIGALTTAP